MSTQSDAELKEFFEMKTMLTGKWVRGSYWVGQILIIWWAIQMMHDTGLFPAILMAAILSFAWRIISEFFIIIFAIHEELVTIRRTLTKQAEPNDEPPNNSTD